MMFSNLVCMVLAFFSNIRIKSRWPGLIACSGVLLLASCASGGPQNAQAPTDEAAPRDVEKLYVVDCLLPPQVRQLGQSVNYLAPRRPIKTTAIDCEIRGGEYVAFDRADYSTALKVWLPKAQEGDAEAQNYVGEIYERGIGSQPDYQIAAAWFKKSAEQNYSRAQINLGNLYEKGLGVERDVVNAMTWYRKASGLTDAGLQFVSSVEITARAADQTELAALRDEVEQQTSDLAQVQQKLKASAGALAKEQQRAKAQKKQLADTKRALNEERKRQTQVAATATPAMQKKISDLELKVKEQQTEAAQQQLRVTELERVGADGQAKLRDAEMRSKETAELRQKVSEQGQQIAALNAQIASAHGQVQGERARVQQMQQDMAQERGRMEQERTRLQQAAGGDKSILQKMEQQMHEREAAIAEKQTLLGKLEKDAAAYKIQLSEMQRAARTDTPPSIEIIDPPLLVTRGLPTIAVNAPVSQREITGRIKALAGVAAFNVNTIAQTVAADGSFKVSIPLHGPETRVTMVAVDRKSRVAKIELMISAPNAVAADAQAAQNVQGVATAWRPQGVEFGTYYALVIGIENYAHMPALPSAAQDAADVEKVLRDKYGFKTRMLGPKVTRYNIMTALNAYGKILTDKDNLLIYYAGHGEYRKDRDEGYWQPTDADADNDANWIPVRAITDMLGTLKAKQIMVVVDSCYSGALSRTAIARDDSSQPVELREKWLKHMAKVRSRTVLTSGGLRPVLDKGEGKNSVFAQSFIAALNNNTSVLEGYRLYYQMYDQVAKVSERLGLKQEPEYAPIKNSGHESGTFFFVPRS